MPDFRSPIDRSATLHMVTQPNADSVLEITPLGEVVFEVTLTHSMTLLLAELARAIEKDEARGRGPQGRRGVRSCAWLYDQVVRNPGRCPNPQGMIRDLVCDLRGRIDAGLQEYLRRNDCPPELEEMLVKEVKSLIQTVRGSGYRLGRRLAVERWSPTDPD